MRYTWTSDAFLSESEDNSEAVTFYRDQGFVVVESIFDDEAIDQLKDHYEGIATERQQKGKTPYQGHLMAHTWDSKILDVAKTQKLLAVIERLLGGRFDLLHSQVTFKPPGDMGFSIHQDNYYNRANPADSIIAVWIAIDDADEENGALVVYPKSHLAPLQDVKKDWVHFAQRAPGLLVQKLLNKMLARERDYFQVSEVIERFAEAQVPADYEPITAAMSRGSVGFMHGNLLHSSGTNVSAERFRRNLLLNYIRHGADYNPGLLSKRSRQQVFEQAAS